MTTTHIDDAIVEDDAGAMCDARELRRHVDEVMAATPVTDLHTHLYAPRFGELNLWGIDELLNYHYLIAELFRSSSVQPEEFWQLNRTEQADLIWRTLFVEQTPLSEATRGVMAVMSTLGLNTRAADLREAREFFRAQRAEDYLERVLKLSCVSDMVMTNDPLDEIETRTWESEVEIDPRFHAALRLDRILNSWTEAAPKLSAQGYQVQVEIDERTISETRRFLADWIARMKPLYLGVSLPDDFAYPEETPRARLLRGAVLPVCREHDLSLALMIGVRRRVNPALRMAGGVHHHGRARFYLAHLLAAFISSPRRTSALINGRTRLHPQRSGRSHDEDRLGAAHPAPADVGVCVGKIYHRSGVVVLSFLAARFLGQDLQP